MSRSVMQSELNAEALAEVKDLCEHYTSIDCDKCDILAQQILTILSRYSLPPNNPAVKGYNVTDPAAA